jgi:hypothetical protein
MLRCLETAGVIVVASDPSDMNDLDRFQLFASRYVAPLPVVTPLPDVFGPWVSIVTAATKAALDLGNVPAGGAVVDLLLAVTRVGSGQANLLSSIKQDTTLLRQEPLKTAMTQIAEARRVGRGDERFTRFVDSAIQNLYRANSLANSLEERAVVQFCIACAYLTLDAPADARSWFGQGVESEREVLNALVKKRLGVGVGFQGRARVTDLRANRSPDTPKRRHRTLNATYGIGKAYLDLLSLGTTLAGQAAVDLRIRMQRLETLERFLYFANALEVSAATASGRTPSTILRLEMKKGMAPHRIIRQYLEKWYLKEIPFDYTRLTKA